MHTHAASPLLQKGWLSAAKFAMKCVGFSAVCTDELEWQRWFDVGGQGWSIQQLQQRHARELTNSVFDINTTSAVQAAILPHEKLSEARKACRQVHTHGHRQSL